MKYFTHHHRLFLYAVLALLPAVSWAQCNGATSAAYLHGNHIRALIDPSGSLFSDGIHSQFTPQFQPPSATTIFAQGFWLGGTDAAGNIKMATPTYGKSSGRYEYFPGPILDESNPTADFCTRWDKTWSVSRSAIEAHLADFNDNDFIDNPIPELLDWPALGNPHLANRLGLELPDNRPMAPFFDQNQDGRYDPLDGDYPNVPQSDVLPDQIVWCVFNDAAAPHAEMPSPPLGVEVQLTAWSFMCTDNIDLNTTVFTSYKIINRSTEAIEQFRAGSWIDFDLGCYEDDYLGSAPDQHTFFVYNKNPFEQPFCAGGVTPFAGDPPVQAVTFLNRPMASFLASIDMNQGLGNTLLSRYNILNGFHFDGTPITPFGDGYNPGSGLPAVAFSFPGDPNVPEQWSAYSANAQVGDPRAIGATALGTLAPGGIVSVDLAYSYHRAAGASHIGNVQVMYEGVERIQAMYDSRFNNTCTQAPICDTDCVWTGDINNDGIANHCDLLPLALYRDLDGPIRLGPFNWQPRDGQPWAVAPQYNGANMKHADANGSGIVTVQDFDYTIQHYGLTRPGYVAPTDSYLAGDDITLLMFGVQTPVFEPDQMKTIRIKLDNLPDNTVGLAFSAEFDERYGQISSVFVHDDSDTYAYGSEVVAGQIDFARIKTNGAAMTIPPSSLLMLSFRSVADFSALPHPTMRFRIKNGKALLADGTEVELGANELELTFNGVVNAVEQPDWYADVAVFPNPASDEAHIQCPHPITDVQLFDLMGRSVPAPVRMNGTQATITTRTLPAGVYAVQIHTAQGRGTWRVVVGE